MKAIAVALALLSSVSVLSQEQKKGKGEPNVDDFQTLVEKTMPVATGLLEKNKEFFPFGATVAADGASAIANGWTGKEQPPSSEVIAVLKAAFKDGAAKGTLRATALVVDVRVAPPGKKDKQDAIQIDLDMKGLSRRVFYPYSLSKKGELLIEDPFVSLGDSGIFGQ